VPTALITGVTGQDGQYLAEHLLGLGYRVVGATRGQQNPKVPSLRERLPDVELLPVDLLDLTSVARAIEAAAPDEIYNLAAVSFVQYSFDHPLLTASVTGVGALTVLEAIRLSGARSTRFYQASSSEMFGSARESPQNELTPFHPRSPYACAKAFAHHTTVNYREAHGLFAVGGILFNHESPRRGLEFVTRRISWYAAAIKLGRERTLSLGDMSVERDWGFAGDYVKAMHLMLQRPVADDFVIGTGVTHSVQQFCAAAFRHVGLRWEDHVVSDPSRRRPADVMTLRADASRARSELGWRPTVGFDELVATMVDSDLRLLTGQTGP
jgi:GDPmannose 4,6-dehydratase